MGIASAILVVFLAMFLVSLVQGTPNSLFFVAALPIAVLVLVGQIPKDALAERLKQKLPWILPTVTGLFMGVFWAMWWLPQVHWANGARPSLVTMLVLTAVEVVWFVGALYRAGKPQPGDTAEQV